MAVYLAPLYAAEEGVARRLLALAEGGSLPTDIDIERAIVWVEQSNRLQLAAQQQEAIRQAIQEKLLVITGGPGTGKTTILRCILQILDKKHRQMLLCSPTGRAAKRMSEATVGRPRPSTGSWSSARRTAGSSGTSIDRWRPTWSL